MTLFAIPLFGSAEMLLMHITQFPYLLMVLAYGPIEAMIVAVLCMLGPTIMFGNVLMILGDAPVAFGAWLLWRVTPKRFKKMPVFVVESALGVVFQQPYLWCCYMFVYGFTWRTTVVFPWLIAGFSWKSLVELAISGFIAWSVYQRPEVKSALGVPIER